MMLAENHPKFVLTRFARFMKLTDRVQEFIEEFEAEGNVSTKGVFANRFIVNHLKPFKPASRINPHHHWSF